MQRDILMLSKAKKLKIKFLWNSWIHLKITTARDKVTMTAEMSIRFAAETTFLCDCTVSHRLPVCPRTGSRAYRESGSQRTPGRRMPPRDHASFSTVSFLSPASQCSRLCLATAISRAGRLLPFFLKACRSTICRPFALSLQQASDEGMTCGGQAEVLVEPLDGTSPATRDFWGETLALLRRAGRGCLVTAILEEGAGVAVEHFLVVDGTCTAVSVAGRTLPTEILTSAVSVPTLVERGAVRYFLDPLTPQITVVVFGGGHIAVCLVPLCHGLGFRIVVVDDRADFASRDRFPHADELLVVPSFENALQDLHLDAGHYVVIVTRGHGGDQATLRQALRRRPGYIGMIGSRRKRGLIFEALAREGVGADDLARVVCPIGLPIGAETPEEIALSIAAELVATRVARAGRGAAR